MYNKELSVLPFSFGFLNWRFLVPDKMQTTLSRSGFLPRTIQNYNFNAKRETFEQENERIVGLHSSESWQLAIFRFWTNPYIVSPPYFSFSFINTKLSIFRECWKVLLEKLGRGHHLVPLYPIYGTKTTYTSATSNQLHENQTIHVADYLQQHQHICHKENSPLYWFVTDV